MGLFCFFFEKKKKRVKIRMDGDAMKPMVLCILDGCGIKEEEYGNAFKQAKTPNFDFLWEHYPHSLLEASGELVGLPKGQMGNSEVGHLNIGAGRIVYQPLQLITEKIKDGSFFQNEEMLEVIKHTKKNHSKLHIFGLLSDGGIHSHINHLFALLDLCKKEDVKELYLHVFLDGRDTLPRSAKTYLKLLEDKLNELGIGQIATISGRYYAMDRDNRFERIQLAYDAMTKNKGEHFSNYEEVLTHNYEKGIDDEFMIPAILNENGMVELNDGLIVFNFRPDRLRELFSCFTNPNFKGFERPFIPNLKLVTMMTVSDEVIYKQAFHTEYLTNTLGEYISDLGLKQLRIAETEKYAHVTYFFDGGIEKELKNCKRILIPSPKVATYDLKPEMSAYEVTDTLLEELEHDYDMVILNYANGDMVGHTGNMEAAIKAVEALDECLGKLYQKVKSLEGTLMIIADHGNCDTMLDPEGNVITSHSTALVPCIITKEGLSLKNGKLADVAPTMLSLMKIEIPKEMKGMNLIK